MKINLGSGEKYLQGWVNIDNSRFAKKDINLNLDSPKIKLPFKDNEADEIQAIDFFEHISNFIPLMNELWRVLDGTLYLETPMAGTVDYYKDPTHIRPLIPETFKYFAEWNTPLYEIRPWTILELRFTTGGENQNRIFCRLKPKK